MILGIEAAHANHIERTGVEEYCFQILREFKKIIPEHIAVRLYTPMPLISELANDLPGHWRTVVLPWPLKKMWSQTRLAYELFRRPPDIFFAPGQLIPWHTPKETVTTIHDSAFLAVPGSYRFFGRQYLRLMNTLVVRRSKKIITTTEFNREELKKYYGAAAADKTVVIPLAHNHLPPPLAGEERARLLARYGIHKPFIMSLGRLETKKNTTCLIEAFNRLRSDHHEVQLFLAGKPGAGFAEVSAALAASPYRSDIVAPGFVPEHQAATLLSAATVFCFPSLYEGFGMPLLQAMALGVPVVASAIDALKEVGGDAALYAPPSDSAALAAALTRIMTDPARRAELVQKGRDRAARFSWEATAKQTLAALLA